MFLNSFFPFLGLFSDLIENNQIIQIIDLNVETEYWCVCEREVESVRSVCVWVCVRVMAKFKGTPHFQIILCYSIFCVMKSNIWQIVNVLQIGKIPFVEPGKYIDICVSVCDWFDQQQESKEREKKNGQRQFDVAFKETDELKPAHRKTKKATDKWHTAATTTKTIHTYILIKRKNNNKTLSWNQFICCWCGVIGIGVFSIYLW